jgi:hypothetical protein
MLKDLKTNLKSLRYGNDQLGGGNSGQPYIVTPLPENANTLQKIKIDATGMSFDFPIRGGALSLINGTNDLVRITKFMLDAPRGPLFLAKQVGLQLSNPKIETGKTAGLENTRIYNLGLNTLAQVPVNALGIHFDRAGALPKIADQNKYLNIVDFKNKNTPEDNRLVKLYTEKILHDTPFADSKFLNKINKKIAKLDKFNSSKFGTFLNKVTNGGAGRTVQGAVEKLKKTLDPKYFLIDDYVGGPGSVYGVGRTTLNRYVFSDDPRTENFAPQLNINYWNLLGASLVYGDIDTGVNETDAKTAPEFLFQTVSTDRSKEIEESISDDNASPNSHLNSLTFNYDIIRGQKIADSGNSVGLIKPDFRKVINDQIGDVLPSTDYKQFNMETRIGIGNPGKLNRDRKKVNIVDLDTQDKINMIPLFKEDIVDTAGGTVTIDGKKYSTRDLIKFRFEAVDNDNPSKTIKIVFRAFINGFKDGINSEWSSYEYNGRGEKFWTYKGFNRTTNLSFKIAAQSRAEMKPLYQKLNYLMSNLAPDYQTNGFMRGPFMLLTIGNWFYRQPGFINSLALDVKDNYSWEIAMDDPENGNDRTMAELPQVLDVNLTFTPVHNFIPRKSPEVPFIFTGTGADNNWLKPEEFNNLR